MAPRRNRGRVFALDLVPPAQTNLFGESPSYMISDRVKRGQRVMRYKREWIIGPTELVDNVLSGRIGFVGDGPIAELWDEAKRDFVDAEVRTGLTTPFAIHLDRLVAMVQDRRPMITVDAVAGALQEILSAGAKNPAHRWQVNGRRGVRNLEEWLQTVAKVTRLSLIVRVPNPSYRDALDLKALMEESEAEVMRLEMESDDGVNVRTPFIAQTQQHIDRGYGDASYSGVVEDQNGTHQSTFSTKMGIEIPNEEMATDQHGEVDPLALRTELVRTIEGEDTSDGERSPAHT